MNTNLNQNFQLLPVEVIDAFPDSIRTYVQQLHSFIQQQQLQIQQQHVEIQSLKTRIIDLENRLSKNSSNSSKPPSSDGFGRKPKSQREKSDKKIGAQQGHVGNGRVQVENPDFVVNHTPEICSECGIQLDQVEGSCLEKRQVFEIPQPKIEVTEHRMVEKRCPCCGNCSKGVFPDNVKAPVQFGERTQALTVYLSHQHFIPVDRVCKIIKDLFGVSIAAGSCLNYSERLFSKLGLFEKDAKKHLLNGKVLHFDETGIRCEKKLHWIHVTASDDATLYTIHAKRGQEAMNEVGILPNFNGVAVHDHWFPYFSYTNMLHGLCNAHHLRELTFIHEEKHEEWAKKMKDLLLLALEEVRKNAQKGFLPSEIRLQVEKMYEKILDEGLLYHTNLPPLPKNKRGRQKQRDGKNLLDRFREYKECVLRFMYDFTVPFTNNQGEQDIRMVKLKQKISGCFRVLTGGQIFCRIRSYISTARKQGWNIWESLSDAIKGSPHLLSQADSACFLETT